MPLLAQGHLKQGERQTRRFFDSHRQQEKRVLDERELAQYAQLERVERGVESLQLLAGEHVSVVVDGELRVVPDDKRLRDASHGREPEIARALAHRDLGVQATAQVGTVDLPVVVVVDAVGTIDVVALAVVVVANPD